MQAYLFDAFISYEKSDRPQVQSLVQALQRAGLRVFWDQMIDPSEPWNAALERAITGSRYSLICVSPNAVASTFVEAEIKWARDRVIPVFLEETTLPLSWEASIGRIQRADLSRSQFAQTEPGFARLCVIISGQKVIAQLTGDETLDARARRLIEKSSIADRSLVIALSILGGAATDMVSLFAADFERRFRESAPHAPRDKTIILESLTSRLQRLHAEAFIAANTRFGVKVDCARFVEPALGHTVLALAWSEYETLRGPIVSWINEWAAESPLWIRLRLAMNLGILAQDERRFDAIWRFILQPILFKNARGRGAAARERFEVADAALSIAAMDPSRKSTVEAILNEMLVDQEAARGLLASRSDKGRTGAAAPAVTNPPAQTAPAAVNGAQPVSAASADTSDPAVRAQTGTDGDGMRDDLAAGGTQTSRIFLAARLALGYTGARYPDLAVRTLRRLAERGNFRALEDILGESFRDRMSASKGAADGSLWDPVDLLAGLLRWAADVPRDAQALPLMIFACGLDELPLAGDQDDQLSLTSIMRRKRGIDTLRKGFLLGLARSDTRDTFAHRLETWSDAQREDPVDPDPVMALACALIYGASPGRDRDRVKFLFRRYDAGTLQALVAQFPVLIERTTP